MAAGLFDVRAIFALIEKMIIAFRSLAAGLTALVLLAAAPRHVLTSDYFEGYAGTHKVSPHRAAQVLSWAEVDSAGAAAISPLGVKTMLYSNPNREQPSDPLFGSDEEEYAHTCGGSRARGESHYAGLVMTNPRSRTLRTMWRRYADSHAQAGHFDAIFADEAVGSAYAQDVPCNYSLDSWLRDEIDLFRSLHYPVVYNGLNDFKNHGIAPEIDLNKAAIGGMMEECYAQLNPDHRVDGWQWWATEETELRMAQERKYFFCYGRDLSPAQESYDGRLYTYASFLLTYDPNTTVLWEYYKTPSDLHVMPESQLVALHPVRAIRHVADLRANEGVYLREYKDCYIAGRRMGACVAAVNPDDDTHALNLRGYRRTLQLQGAGIIDGGTVRIANDPPPRSLASRGAVIAFK
jgi:hypothetical protein